MFGYLDEENLSSPWYNGVAHCLNLMIVPTETYFLDILQQGRDGILNIYSYLKNILKWYDLADPKAS